MAERKFTPAAQAALDKKPAPDFSDDFARQFRDAFGHLTADDVRRIVREELERYGFRPPGGG